METNTNWKQIVLDELKKVKEKEYEEFMECKLNIIILLLVISSRILDPEDYLYEALIFLLDKKIKVVVNFYRIENIDKRFEYFISEAMVICWERVPEPNRPKKTQFSTHKQNWLN
jgi:hypothetical protein